MNELIYRYVSNRLFGFENSNIITFFINRDDDYGYYSFEVYFLEDGIIELCYLEINDNTPDNILEYLKSNNMYHDYISSDIEVRYIKIYDKYRFRYFPNWELNNRPFVMIYDNHKQTLLKTLDEEYDRYILLDDFKFDYKIDYTLKNARILREF